MNNKIKMGIISAIGFISLMGIAQAADVTINISGQILASPCVVDGTSPIGVDLGQNLQTSDLAAAGSYSQWKTFSINLKNCPSSKTNVVATFSGSGDADDLTRLYTNAGTATNVAVELQSNDASHTSLGNNQTMTVARAVDNTAVFPLQSRVWSKGNASTGTIATVVSVTFTYN